MAYWGLARASHVVSVSPYVADHLKRFMFYHGDKEVIPNGMLASLFEQVTPVKKHQRPFTITTALSNRCALKNGTAAIKAFTLFKRDFPFARMIMFGAGYGLGEAAEQWAREHGNFEGIEFAGYRPHGEVLSRLAEEADVLLHTSLEESHGMPLSEAMALNIPVIGGEASGGVPWALDEGRAGILVDVTSPSDIAAALRRLAQSSDESQALGARGRALAKERFHIETVADAYQAIYAELALSVTKP